jgi:hypothetical protein
MIPTFNVYCDESCHLEHDRQQAMVLGAVWCPLGKGCAESIRCRRLVREAFRGETVVS